MRIRAKLRCMAESEILGMIPPARLAEIKRGDPTPMFKAFVVGHEGEARGYLIGVGNIVKQWFKSAVEKLHAKIETGLQLFHGHTETNDTAGRVPIGEVVGKTLLQIKEKLSSVVACYIFPSFRHLPLDVASIEADVDLEQNERAGLYVAGVNGVTGIALGYHETETPGFAGATLLGQIQAFARKNIQLGGNDNMTLEEIRAAIQEGRFRPSDIYDPEVLFADPVIKDQVKEKVRNATGYDMRKHDELINQKAELERKLKDGEQKIKDQDERIRTLTLDTAKTQVGSIFEKQKELRKLDEKQVKYIKIRLPKFSPQKPEELDKEFNAYLDTELDEYGKFAKELGIETKPADHGKVPKPGTGSEGGTNEGGDDESKYINPATNPMIKTD